jgi:resuscitation-promoting factor RpfB
MKRKLLIVIGGILLIAFTAVAVTKVKSGEQIKSFQQIQLQNRDNELKLEQIESQKLEQRLNDGETKSQQEIDQLKKEIEQRKQNEDRLQRELQAKLDAKKAEQDRIAQAANRLTGTATASAAAAPRAFTGGGNKEAWLAASGIPRDQWWAVDSIVSRESGWNPCAYNPGRSDCSANPSSACGLAQSLPCGKQAKYGHWTDPVANLKWQYEYVTGRYGGYPQAVAFWNANHWY